jgi:hypothetical protein
MKITRQQLTQIINEEAKVAAEALGKQGFLKRMAGKVGFGTIKNFTKEVKRLRKDVLSFLEETPEDDPRKAKAHFEAYEDDISGWLAKLADYANATEQQVPNRTQRLHVVNTGKRLTQQLTMSASYADSMLASKIRHEADVADRKAREAKKQKDLEAKWAAEEEAARQPKPWSQMSKAERHAAANRMDQQDRSEFYDQYSKSKPTDIYQENKKITISQLQQIVQEEIVKLNEEK